MTATIDLNLLRAFVAVAETSSFSLAAARIGLPKSSVSRAIQRLEESLGVTLLHRTTRTVALSTSGEALYARTAPRLRDLELTLADLPDLEEQPSGELKVTASVDFGATVLADIIARFVARHPAIHVDMRISNELVDLVAEGIDVAFRISMRRLADSALQARKLGPMRMQLFAAPTYLAKRGTPRTPADLDAHDWVAFGSSRTVQLASAGATAKVGVHGRVRGDDMSFVRDAVRAGAGVAVLPTFLVEDDVTAGAIVRVLPKWDTPSGDLWLVVPGRAVPRKVAAFRDFAIEALAARGFGS